MATLIDKLYSIRLGVQGENVANPVEIDMTPWVDRFPNAGLHILFKRYNEITPYPVVTEFDGTNLKWIPTVTDTAIIGVGYAEIRAIDPNTGLVKKSRVVPTAVENSVSGLDSEYIPDPFVNWVNKVLAAKDSTMSYRDDAKEYRDDAEYFAALAGEHSGILRFEIGPDGGLYIYRTPSLPYRFALEEDGGLYCYVRN